MANNRRGEYDFEINGLTLTLKFDMNALAEMEGQLGEDFQRLLDEAGSNPSVRLLRAALWAGLNNTAKFARKPLSIQKVGSLITQDNFPTLINAVSMAMSSMTSGKTPDELQRDADKPTKETTGQEGEESADPFASSTGTPPA